MTVTKFLRIGEVTARTGLTERALRHYEAEGLISPERSGAGQRLYSKDDIGAIATISVLRRAGFSLAEIRDLRARGAADIDTLLAAQIDALKLQAEAAGAAIDMLERMRARLKSGEATDIELLCEVAATAEACEASSAWRAVFDRYFDAEQQARWSDLKKNLAKSVDPEAYDKAFGDLAEDIKSAQPIDPTSSEAQALLDRWDALLEPFARIASPREMAESRRFWSSVGEWGANVDTPVTQAVVDFIKAAREARCTNQGK